MSPPGPDAPRQLVLDLPHREARGRDDFLVSAANAAAVAAVDAWPDWPGPALAVVGPAGSGKSHLAAVWQARTGAALAAAGGLAVAAVPNLLGSGACVVEDLPGEDLDERALFHLLNLARESGAHVLITSRTYPAQWPVDLPDLASRLKATAVAALGRPDDDLLRGVLVKLFADRQIGVDEAVVSYLIARMERSFAAARDLVAEIDRRALAEASPVTRAFVARLLRERAAPGLFDGPE